MKETSSKRDKPSKNITTCQTTCNFNNVGNIKSIQQIKPQIMGRKTFFWHFGSFKTAFSWFLNHLSWPGNVAKCCNTFRSIWIWNIKSIQQTKVQKLAKNLCFGSLDHSKMHFLGIWMIHQDLVILSNAGKHSVLLHYAISSISNRPKSEKWSKTSFQALWIIQKCIFVIFEWSIITW